MFSINSKCQKAVLDTQRKVTTVFWWIIEQDNVQKPKRNGRAYERTYYVKTVYPQTKKFAGEVGL